jgi:beta-carotene/zeaxanthin 4-ketolase
LVRSYSQQALQPVGSSIQMIERWGVPIAGLILSTWAISLMLLLTLDLGSFSFWLLLPVLWQTFLCTGLFITAHDAMHGAVAPQHLKLNRRIGTLALIAYGLLPYRRLLKAHHQHHLYPASDRDPDFHDGKHQDVVLWYLHFMRQYWNTWQWLGMAGIYNILHRMGHIAELNLILFWAVPPLLSSMQLFYFGTFLVHQSKVISSERISCINSTYRPLFWSFVTCYHFGFHREHHDHPHVAWWQLPDIVKQIPLADRS